MGTGVSTCRRSGKEKILAMLASRVALLCVYFPFTVGLHQYQPSWASLDSRPLPRWYDEAKVGIFVHWGLFSVPSYGGGRSAGEWFWENWVGRKQPWIVEFMQRNFLADFTYPDFAPSFKAELFDPHEWVDLFEKAGAKYIVITSKHHEGWANWPSKEAWNWNSMDSGPHRDLIGELANATRNGSSLRFGVYHSLFEWFHPLFLFDQSHHYHTQRYVTEVVMPQLYELVSRYEPHLIWSDGDWDGNSSYWNSTHFLAWLYNSSPVKSEVVVNDRWGSDCSCTHGGYFTCLGWRKDTTLHTHKWESYYSVMKGSWGYCRDYDIRKYNNMSTIISQLVSAVSRGGNFLLNVGPTHDGRIPPLMEERLLQLGLWLNTNGEAIYNSTYWSHQNDSLHPDTVRYTYNAVSKTVYAILLEWPEDYTITLASVQPLPNSQVTLLGYDTVSWTISGGYLNVFLPYLPLDSPLHYGWTLKFIV